MTTSAPTETREIPARRTMAERTRDILARAVEILDGGRNWVQRVEARSEDGRTVHNTSPDAVCWCAQGALRRAMADTTPDDEHDDEYGWSWEAQSAAALADDAIRKAAGGPARPDWQLTRWNDTIGQSGPSVCRTMEAALGGIRDDYVRD